MNRRIACCLLLGMISVPSFLSSAEPGVGVKDDVRELRKCGQLIVVTTESWEATFGEFRRYERMSGRWVEVGSPMRANVGQKGLAWGIGLHGTFPEGAAQKREGDRRAPAGVFALDEAFGAATAEQAGIKTFPYRQMTPAFAGVDDPASKHYNRIVDATRVKKDWKSAEQMLSTDGTYRLGVVIRHNWPAFASYGSCIFLHVWKGEEIGTAGCTALVSANVDKVVRWLDAAKRPLLVQLPRAEYDRRKIAWGLPD